MNSQLKEFYHSLFENRFFDNKIYFLSLEMLSDNDIKKHFLEPINRNTCMYLYNVHNDNDIILGTKYNVIFDRNNPRIYQNLDCEIDFVSLKKGDNIGIIPSGYGGIIRLKFKDEVPEITKVLMQDDKEKYDRDKHSFLYFTTQEVIDEILAELEKA